MVCIVELNREVIKITYYVTVLLEQEDCNRNYLNHNWFNTEELLITFLKKNGYNPQDHGKTFLAIQIKKNGKIQHLQFKEKEKGYPKTIEF